jgi:hypothetical protein
LIEAVTFQAGISSVLRPGAHQGRVCFVILNGIEVEPELFHANRFNEGVWSELEHAIIFYNNNGASGGWVMMYSGLFAKGGVQEVMRRTGGWAICWGVQLWTSYLGDWWPGGNLRGSQTWENCLTVRDQGRHHDRIYIQLTVGQPMIY